MIVRKYGIELQRLTAEDIELVRTKRNSDTIRQYMFYREEISREAQEKWFASIQNIYNYYFLIIYKGQKIGLIHGKNVNYEERSTEGGIFIWEAQYWATFVPVLASVIMTELTFSILDMDRTFAEVLSSNTRSKDYNRHLGYVLYSENKAANKEIHVLTRENYHARAGKIRNAVQNITKDASPVSWHDIDLGTVTDQEIRRLYDPLPEYLRNPFMEHLQGRPR
jgi:RimJ/RimL family protein N-acetyltransferase